MQTAYGSLFKSLQLKKEDHLLIRGGTSSIGLAAAALAKGLVQSIGMTTRRKEREGMLKDAGADEVYIDDGNISDDVRRRKPEGYN